MELRTTLRCRFAGKYTEPDVTFLAEVDRAHERLSDPATQRILKHEHEECGKAEYGRLAGISVSHIYNLRNSVRYRRQAAIFERTRPSANSIGERRRPEPRGRPGYLRVDTVHQGDWDGVKGVYHINAVDAVTQWQAVGCAPRINAENLKPVLEAMLHQFPFPILGFHVDNGSEYINYSIAEMMRTLMVDFTKSRACRSEIPRHRSLIRRGFVKNTFAAASISCNPHLGRSRMFQTGIQYTPVDSIATSLTLCSFSHSAGVPVPA